MTIRVSQLFPKPARQRGAATLLVVLVLLIAMSMISVTTMRSGMVEQQITGNDMRAREAFEGSDAGIEYGLAYLTNDSTFSNYKALTWTTSGGFQSSSPAVASGNIASGNFSYAPNVTYQRALNSDYIRIVSAASETHDNTIGATNEQYVKVQPILNGGSGFNAPPVAMNGCLTDVTGSPDVYVGTRADNIAAGTSDTRDQGVWGDGNDADNPCLKQGANHLNAHGGQPVGALFSTADGKTAWEYVFGTYTRAQIQAKADAEVAEIAAGERNVNDRNYIWETNKAPYGTSWGSATHPVILVFDADAECPKINGGTTIYGVVFIDAPCTANGWGGATVYGTVIVNGDMSKLNSNTTIYDWSDPVTGSTIKLGNSFIDGIYKIPGTWKDF